MEILETLQKNKFKFEKKYGQNFITDTNLLKSIVSQSGLTEKDNVLEIGPGAGTLTRELCASANKVLAYEVDTNLKPILENTLKDIHNVHIRFQDFMTATEQEINQELGDSFFVVANLPYYITTPIIFKLLSMSNVKKIVVMVQKEVAERMIATQGKDYGILSVMLNYYCDTKIQRIVKRNMFTPAPNVDSAIVELTIHKAKFKCDNDVFSKIVHSAFAMRRKTIANNLSSSLNISKDEVADLISPISPTTRAEALTIQQFVDIANAYKNLNK